MKSLKQQARDVGLSLCLAVAPLGAGAEVVFTQIAEFDVPEADQGIAVDKDHFYAVDNRTIAKYDKATGTLVDRWDDAADGSMIHLDSAMVRNGRIYAAHSNYRRLPMTSSIEVWDARTMEHIGSYSLGRSLGSFTWFDYHDGYWWGAFANYDRLGPDGKPYGGTINTTLAQFDKDWNILQTWIFPPELLERFEIMSNSGGSWGPDGYLYLTGHDLAEVYKVRLPASGSVLEVEEIIPLNVHGQGIAWDRHAKTVLYGILRATDEEEAQGIGNRVVVFQSNIPARLADRNARLWQAHEQTGCPATGCSSHP